MIFSRAFARPLAALLVGLALAGCGNDRSGGVSEPPPGEPEPPSAPTLTLDVEPATPQVGDDYLVRWRSTQATTCTAGGAWSGVRPATGDQRFAADAPGTVRYTLRCRGAGGEIQRSVDVEIGARPGEPEPPTLSLMVAPDELRLGDTYELSWTSDGAETCIAEEAWTGERPTQGREAVRAETLGERHHTLRCSGAGGQTQRRVSATVQPLPEEPEDPAVAARAEFERVRGLERGCCESAEGNR
ncbi:MAG TPA: hypothetical protein VGE57_06035 [Solimonas sp.]